MEIEVCFVFVSKAFNSLKISQFYKTSIKIFFSHKFPHVIHAACVQTKWREKCPQKKYLLASID